MTNLPLWKTWVRFGESPSARFHAEFARSEHGVVCGAKPSRGVAYLDRVSVKSRKALESFLSMHNGACRRCARLVGLEVTDG